MFTTQSAVGLFKKPGHKNKINDISTLLLDLSAKFFTKSSFPRPAKTKLCLK